MLPQIILFAPLAGAVIAGFGWRIIGEQAAQYLTTGLLFLACLLSWIVFFGFDGQTQQIHILNFIQSGSLDTAWSIRLDRLTAIMLVVVTTVSALVHMYSLGYMDGDSNWGPDDWYKARFFAYLSFFTFAMLALVTADNLVQMFFGWEGVGVASYLLIGFYYRKDSANAAAIKAFVVNRVGDFGFALGIFGLFYLVDSINLKDVFAAAPTLAETQVSFLWSEWNAANLIAVLLFIGAMGKSAQLFLHTWLPDAMEGPTPVSALIHAATMVTAGVFLVVRMSPLFEYAPEAKTLVLVIGASTAFFAATVGLVQNDIKRVIAYSTCSQLGYMFAAAGVGLYSVAMFHLFTHAFFKAVMFLSAGSVITAMHHEQDMRNMGGLRRKLPVTYWTMMAGGLALTGVGIPFSDALFGFPIGFAGFLSKDAIVEGVWAGTAGGAAFWLLVVAAAFTSFYTWRQMFMVFHGAPRGDMHAHEHAHESPWTMLTPLVVLAIGAVFAGMIWYKPFFGEDASIARFFAMPPEAAAAAEGSAEPAATAGSAGETTAATAAATPEAAAGGAPAGAIYMSETSFEVLKAAHEAPEWVKLSPFVAMLAGLFTAWMFYIRRPDLPGKWAAANPVLYRFLLNKWYFDEIYDFFLVGPARRLASFLWKRGDGEVIDGTINGVAMGVVPFLTRLAGRAQTGYVFTYAFAMVLGLALLITWMMLAGGK
ncbi:MAG: NADH-quinone oxidoreductase subunit L [Pseudomonadota bacterium]